MNTPSSAADLVALHAPELAEPLRAQLAAAAEMLASVWPRGALLGYFDCEGDGTWPLPKPIRDLGFDRLSAGGERVVLFHKSGEWCLKVPRGCGYEFATRREVAMLGEMSEPDRQLFARTISLPGDVLLQRVYRIDPVRFAEFERESREILHAQWRLGVRDVNPINVGWTDDDRWCFIDWAGVCRRAMSFEPQR